LNETRTAQAQEKKQEKPKAYASQKQTDEDIGDQDEYCVVPITFTSSSKNKDTKFM
jgi:hypothetical protein